MSQHTRVICPICYGMIEERTKREFHPACHQRYRKHYERLRVKRTREVNRSLTEEESKQLRKDAVSAAMLDYSSSVSGS